MGSVDIQSKAYFSDSVHFADAFNFYVYGGRQVVKPSELMPLDSTEIALPYGSDAREPRQRIRDVIKLWQVMSDDRAVYVVMGVEVQEKTHYAMPVRCALYDSINYARQVEEAARSYRSGGEHKLSGTEYLSGFRKSDRLMPVITLVMYLGSDRWDGPRSLREMLAGCGDSELMRLVPNYKLNLVVPAEVDDEDFDRFVTHLGKALKYIKHSRRREDLERMIREDEAYRRLDRDSAELVNTVTGSGLVIPQGEEKVDMCQV